MTALSEAIATGNGDTCYHAIYQSIAGREWCEPSMDDPGLEKFHVIAREVVYDAYPALGMKPERPPNCKHQMASGATLGEILNHLEGYLHKANRSQIAAYVAAQWVSGEEYVA